jgi:hypothetical protein
LVVRYAIAGNENVNEIEVEETKTIDKVIELISARHNLSHAIFLWDGAAIAGTDSILDWDESSYVFTVCEHTVAAPAVPVQLNDPLAHFGILLDDEVF